MEELLERLKKLEDRVKYLESGTKKEKEKAHDFDAAIKDITVEDHHLSQILVSNMEDQLISIIAEYNRDKPFIQLRRQLYKYKEGWVVMADSDLIYLFENMEFKVMQLYSKTTQEQEKYFDNNKIIYGLNITTRLKKIKTKLIEHIML